MLWKYTVSFGSSSRIRSCWMLYQPKLQNVDYPPTFGIRNSRLYQSLSLEWGTTRVTCSRSITVKVQHNGVMSEHTPRCLDGISLEGNAVYSSIHSLSRESPVGEKVIIVLSRWRNSILRDLSILANKFCHCPWKQELAQSFQTKTFVVLNS